LPVLAVRLRLQDMARLTADALVPPLAANPHVTLQLLNIAGGPAIGPRAATRPCGIEVFRSLAERAGWSIVRCVERPLSDQVVLTPNV
jgi:hypothetical protein